MKIHPRTHLDLHDLFGRPSLCSSDCFTEKNGLLFIRLPDGLGGLSAGAYKLGKIRRAGWNAIWTHGKFAAVDIHNTGWSLCDSVREARKLFNDN